MSVASGSATFTQINNKRGGSEREEHGRAKDERQKERCPEIEQQPGCFLGPGRVNKKCLGRGTAEASLS